MNKILFHTILFALLLYSCSTSIKITKKNKMDMDIELFDLSFYKIHKKESGSMHQLETLNDGTEIIYWKAFNDKKIIVNILEPPFLLTKIKEFNEAGKLIAKGLQFSECRIGEWLECDENGADCKIIDYEKDRGKFSYNDVFNFLKKKKYVNKKPKTSDDQERFNVEYSYEQNIWTITATRHVNPLGYYYYELDGDTGAVLKEKYISTIY